MAFLLRIFFSGLYMVANRYLEQNWALTKVVGIRFENA